MTEWTMEHGIRIERVQRSRLQDVLKSLGDPAADEKDTGLLVAAVNRQFAKMVEDIGECGECSECTGRSPQTYLDCPFCGAKGAVEDWPGKEPSTTGPGVSNVAMMSEGAVNDVSENNGSNGTSEATTAIVRRTKKQSGVIKVDPAEPIDVEAIVVEAIDDDPPRVPDDVLDANLAECLAAKVSAVKSMWKLGCVVRLNVEQELWKRRRTTEGKQAYPSFDAWCARELRMTHGNVYELMDVSKGFTENEVEGWGVTKCALLLRAPEGARPEIKKKIDEGASVREVRSAVNASRVKAGVVGVPRLTGRKPMPQPKKRHNSDKITVAMMNKRQLVPLFCRSTLSSKEPKPAKRIGDEPTADFELANHVTLRIAVSHDSKGNLCVWMTPKRDK